MTEMAVRRPLYRFSSPLALFRFARFKGLAGLASTCSTCQHQLSPPPIGALIRLSPAIEGLAIRAGRLGAAQGTIMCRRATETVAVAELDFARLEPWFPPTGEDESIVG